MSQAPTPSETPITDALEEAGLLTVEFSRRLERDRARLMEALRESHRHFSGRPLATYGDILVMHNVELLLKELTC